MLSRIAIVVTAAVLLLGCSKSEPEAKTKDADPVAKASSATPAATCDAYCTRASSCAVAGIAAAEQGKQDVTPLVDECKRKCGAQAKGDVLAKLATCAAKSDCDMFAGCVSAAARAAGGSRSVRGSIDDEEGGAPAPDVGDTSHLDVDTPDDRELAERKKQQKDAEATSAVDTVKEVGDQVKEDANEVKNEVDGRMQDAIDAFNGNAPR